MIQAEKKSEVREALYSLSPWVIRVLLFSLVTNILVLTPSGYMLEVYDRVVNSRNHQTLLMLTMLVVGLYIVLEALEWVRSGIMQDAALAFDRRMRRRVFDTAFAARLKNLPLG
ncbi:MAG: type I secretion system permease/ATPase, partial [Chlorobiaceae bacterium]|nr:type I secretion system permease/ATPase [Chlorobiaceae bacterium]